ncbi:MAG: hypothetical protein P8X39_13345, partial [Desulfofustis sp.]
PRTRAGRPSRETSACPVEAIHRKPTSGSGRVPMDPRVVMAGDDGKPYLSSDEESPATAAFGKIVSAVERRLPPVAPISMFKPDGGAHGKN